MKTLYLLSAISFGIAASLTCRAESPELTADTEDSLTDENLPAVLEQIDPPNVPKEPISLYIPTQNEIICRKEARIGTRLLKMVCRSKAGIATNSAEAQRWLRKVR
jgi:hypothetical protein